MSTCSMRRHAPSFTRIPTYLALAALLPLTAIHAQTPPPPQTTFENGSPDVPSFTQLPDLTPRLIDRRIIEAAGRAPPPANGVTLNSSTQVLNISGTLPDNVASVSVDASGLLSVTLNGYTWSFEKSSVREIYFVGGSGTDQFTNTTDIDSVIKGGSGNDVLRGGSGDDFVVGGLGQDTLEGGAGNDVLWGSGGSDKMYGGPGRDDLRGHGGNDEMHGGEDRDSMNGGSGNDTLFGDSGQDLMVSVGAGNDTLTGGPQWDNYWTDTADVITDPSALEQSMGYVHVIDKFRGFSNNGGVTALPIALDPAGEDLPDPTRLAGHDGEILQNYADHPLFAKGGPSKNDIFQGAVGDCWFMARLSILADADPEFIRRSVADLGDGSFAVRFKRNGQDDYVRVDADFWTSGGSGQLTYARVGQEGALWVPVIEKALAIARKDAGSYASLSGGGGTHLSSLGVVGEPVFFNTDPLYTPAEIVAAYKQPLSMTSAHVLIRSKVEKAASDLLTAIKTHRANGTGLVTGTMAYASNSLPLIAPATGVDHTFRRGAHVYMIDRVEHDINLNREVLVLRDPWGLERRISDPARLYFCIGRFNIVTGN